MELTQILIIAGVIGGVILVAIAIRGSFKSDDAFYGDSTTVAGGGPTGDAGEGHHSSDGQGGDHGGVDGGGGSDGGGGDGGGGSSD